MKKLYKRIKKWWNRPMSTYKNKEFLLRILMR